MRCFIAIPAPEEIEKELFRVQRHLSGLAITSSFHFTLKFLGDIEKPYLVMEALKEVSFKQFSLVFHGIGAFPDWHSPKVIWVGVKKSPELQDLQQQVAKATDKFRKDDSPFHPHVTLARVKSQISNAEKIRKLEIKPLTFPIVQFALFSSKLLPTGTIYEPLHSCLARP